MHCITGGFDLNSPFVFASPGSPPLFFAHSLLSRSILLMPGRNASLASMLEQESQDYGSHIENALRNFNCLINFGFKTLTGEAVF